MLDLFLFFIAIFMLTVLLVLLTVCLPSSCDLIAQGFLPPLIPVLSNSLTQKLTSVYSKSFMPFTGRLWNLLPASVFPTSYDLFSFKREVSRQLLPNFG
ncbi:hypothetical protein E2C01_049737 [Portunus trituberculatus]|uniref:Uncharacterized protein n=1 Tax=Portunus trituberculatus TaxID=210409 RepID=A0A5B7GEN7_PORTR|nr:hypothetical protein [Portunus trituberculatus]